MKTIKELEEFIEKISKLEGQDFLNELINNSDEKVSTYGIAHINFKVKDGEHYGETSFFAEPPDEEGIAIGKSLGIEDPLGDHYDHTWEMLERLLIREKHYVIQKLKNLIRSFENVRK